jgi:hypothetical protein
MSMDAFAGPVVTSNRRSVNRSSSCAGKGVRSRIATTTSYPASRRTSSSGSPTCSVNTSVSASSDAQSARDVATPW